MATFTLSGSVQFIPKLVDGAVTWTDSVSSGTVLSSGTGSGQANGYWSGTLTVATGGAVTIDLTALAYSLFGGTGTVAFATVKHLVLINQSAGVSLTVGPGTSNGWSQMSGAILGKSGIIVAHSPVTGLPVTSTSKTLKVTSTDASVTLAGSIASGSATVAGLSSTANLAAGMSVTGTGIPANTKISAVTSGYTVTLTANATATNASASLTFQWPSAVVNVYVAGVLQ